LQKSKKEATGLHVPPEEEYKSNHGNKSHFIEKYDFAEEENKILQGAKNPENKDDFWISLYQQLIQKQDKKQGRTPCEPPKEGLFEEISLEENVKYSSPNIIQKSLSHTDKHFETYNEQDQFQPNQMFERSPTFSSGDKGDLQNNDSNSYIDDDSLSLTKQITLEEQEKIKQMIETPMGTEDDEVDNYLDKLDNDDSD